MRRPLHEISLDEIYLVFCVDLHGLFAGALKLLFVGAAMLQIGELYVKLCFFKNDFSAVAEQILWGLLFL